MNGATNCTAEDKLTIGLDEAGTVLEESRIPTTPKAFSQRFRTMPSARLVLEAGTHSPWSSRLLAELGHEVIVANPRMLRFIYGNDSKNDKADAAYLARVGKLDPGLLHPLVHRSEARMAIVGSFAAGRPWSAVGSPHRPRPQSSQTVRNSTSPVLDR